MLQIKEAQKKLEIKYKKPNHFSFLNSSKWTKTAVMKPIYKKKTTKADSCGF